MAITRGNTTQYVVPNGRVEFNRFPIVNGLERPNEAKGFRYLGSTSEFTLTYENETLTHQSSECGFNVDDMSVIVSSSLSGSLTIDNLSSENLAMFFSGDVETVAQLQATGRTQIIKAYPSLGYRLGVDTNNLNGVFAVKVTKIETFASESDAKTGTAVVETLTADTDFEVNSNTGYLMIGDEATQKKVVPAGTWIKVTYDLEAAKRDVIVSKGQVIVGEIVFRGCNAVGENREYYIPKAQLTATGDFSMKGGEEWATIGFEIKALQHPNHNTLLYINSQPVK